ncbi:hypothetical protein NDU88_003630, partial [Pleurodeles waltl]
ERDGAEVLQVAWVSRRFLQQGVDFSVFPALGEGGRRKRGVDDGLEVRAM